MSQMGTVCYTIILIWVTGVLGVVQIFWFESDGYWVLYNLFDMSQNEYWVLYKFFDMS